MFPSKTGLQSVAERATNNETSTMHVTRLSAELSEIIAKFCVETNELRSVYNVAEDLLALQLVCTTTSTCAVKLWPSVAKLCVKKFLDDLQACNCRECI